jgi:lipopolysaccharide transport system permease protein
MPTSLKNLEELVIEANCSQRQYWRELWHYRELFYFLVWRDVLVRYKQTVIGLAWALLRPLLTMLIFTLVFGNLAKLPSQGIPYPLLVFTGLLPWQFFASALSETSDSLINNANLISKVYFPRLLVPISAVFVSFIDFLCAGLLLLGLMCWFKISPGWQLLTLPVFILLTTVTAMGIGLWLAALNAKYRDFRFVIPFLLQLGLYLSPVGFSSSLVPDEWRWLYSLNPLVGIIDGFRWALLGETIQFYWPGFGLSVALAGLLLAGGLSYFRRHEQLLTDTI